MYVLFVFRSLEFRSLLRNSERDFRNVVIRNSVIWIAVIRNTGGIPIRSLNGLRLFAMSIKNAVVRKRTPQSRERFDAGRGEFRSAAERGLNRQRDHQSP